MNFAVKSIGLTNDENNFTKAIATICIDDVFNIEGVTVKKSKDNNLYVQLPQKVYTDKETGERKYKDACYPTTRELREQINNVVMDVYYEKLKEKEDSKEEQKKTKNVDTKEKSNKKTKEEKIEETEEECI